MTVLGECIKECFPDYYSEESVMKDPNKTDKEISTPIKYCRDYLRVSLKCYEGDLGDKVPINKYGKGQLSTTKLECSISESFRSLLKIAVVDLADRTDDNGLKERISVYRGISLGHFFSSTVKCWKKFIEDQCVVCDSKKFLKLERWSRFVDEKNRLDILCNIAKSCCDRGFYMEAKSILSIEKEYFLSDENKKNLSQRISDLSLSVLLN